MAASIFRSSFIRFGMVSAFGVVVDLAVAWTLAALVGLPLVFAAFCGFIVAAAINYVLHERWTFGGGSALSATRGGLYLASLTITLGVRLLAVAGIESAFNLGKGQELFALVPAVGLSFLANYAMSRFLIFSTAIEQLPGDGETEVDPAGWQIPAHATRVRRPAAHEFALVIPVINEGEQIREQLQRTAATRLPVDIVIADGGSTDGSLDEDLLEETGVRALLVKQGPGKLSAQLRMAYAWCLAEGYRGIVTIDGNGKDNVEAIAEFVGKLSEGFDYVQGSRYRPGGLAENTPLERTIGNRLIHAPLMSMAGRRWLTDTTNGFRGYSRRYLLDPRVQPFRDVFANYELLFYLTVRAGQLGYRVCEIPVRRSYPLHGKTPTKIGGFGGKLAILRQAITAACGAFTPTSDGR